jgi:hypothetical protein
VSALEGRLQREASPPSRPSIGLEDIVAAMVLVVAGVGLGAILNIVGVRW